MEDPNNPSAFAAYGEGCGQAGMTLRDWFAGQCDVSEYLPASSYINAKGREPTVEELAKYIADIRFIEADAMLAARKKEPAQ